MATGPPRVLQVQPLLLVLRTERRHNRQTARGPILRAHRAIRRLPPLPHRHPQRPIRRRIRSPQPQRRPPTAKQPMALLRLPAGPTPTEPRTRRPRTTTGKNRAAKRRKASKRSFPGSLSTAFELTVRYPIRHCPRAQPRLRSLLFGADFARFPQSPAIFTVQGVPFRHTYPVFAL